MTTPARIKPLSCQRQLIPVIASSLYLEWGDLPPWSSPAVIEARFRSVAAAGVFPFCLVAISESGEFLGTASVKLNEVPSHPDKLYWLGEVFVPMPFRRQGIATRLIEEIVEYSFSSGADCLYLYTPDQQDWYRRLGWEPCCQEIVNGESVTIMVRRQVATA